MHVASPGGHDLFPMVASSWNSVRGKCVGVPTRRARPGASGSSPALAVPSLVALSGLSLHCALASPRPPTPGLWPVRVHLQRSYTCVLLLGSAFPLVPFAVHPSKSMATCPAPPASSLSPAGLWRLCCSRVGKSGRRVQFPGPRDRSGAWVRAGLFGDRLPVARVWGGPFGGEVWPASGV